MDWAKFGEFGLSGLMIGAIILLLWFIVKWVLEHTKELLAQQAKERESWNAALEKHNEALQKIVASIDKHDEKADERGRYVRDEHKEMMTILGRINGYRKDA